MLHVWSQTRLVDLGLRPSAKVQHQFNEIDPDDSKLVTCALTMEHLGGPHWHQISRYIEQALN